MNKKKNILIVTNTITQEEVYQIKQALDASKPGNLHIKLNLVHVIPTLPTSYFNISSMGLLIEKYYDEAKESLLQVGKHLNIQKKDQWLITGKIRTEVLCLANKLSASFVLASAEQIKELHHSLFFKNINQYAKIKAINQVQHF